MKQISMKDLYVRKAKLGKNEVILDVREPDEYAAGHVEGSLNIPVGEVEKHVAQLSAYDTIYVHCRSGKRSVTASEKLTKAGLKNLVCVAGSGMMDWEAAGYPVAKGK